MELQRLCAEAYERKNLPVRLIGVGVRFIDLRKTSAFFQLELFNNHMNSIPTVSSKGL